MRRLVRWCAGHALRACLFVAPLLDITLVVFLLDMRDRLVVSHVSDPWEHHWYVEGWGGVLHLTLPKSDAPPVPVTPVLIGGRYVWAG